MNISDLEEELSNLFPEGFSIEKDNFGQLIIYTNLTQDDDGELVTLEGEENMEEESLEDFDD